MKKEEIEHLARLARIKLTETELENLETDLSSIVTYVSEVSELVADKADAEPSVGAVHNVFRTDEVTNQADEYTDDIMREMPATDGRFLEVKKILQTED
jgi:aspartyl-tRNA(Asn)/glutamyl-tRNA(Gln) amidotransferase subunit C